MNFKDIQSELHSCAPALKMDASIEETERTEQHYKELLRKCAESDDPAVALLVAKTQKEIGFILKYKSYGIKATTPLGFSLFFLEPDQGFSFQRHRDFKIEVFHFLEIKNEKSFAFLCESDDWEKAYKPEKFSQWLNGVHDEAYAKLCYTPKPGDVLRVDRPGIVHTAIGCVLEEYANVSSDMVDRLHDQNKSRTISMHYTREYFLKMLSRLQYPRQSQLVQHTPTGFSTHHLESEDTPARIKLLETDTVIAQRVFLKPGETWQLDTHDAYNSLFVSEGDFVHVQLMAYKNKVTDATMMLSLHDTFLSLPQSSWQIKNTGLSPLSFSMLAIHMDHALR